MKKQLLVLAMVALGTTMTVSAQPYAVPGTPAVPLTCALNDPLTPIAGRPYDYSALISPTGTGSTSYWYATKSTTFMTGGARVATEIPADGTQIATTATNYRTLVNDATSPTSTQVTWTSAALDGVNATTNPLFMVVEYKGPLCANNMKVMQIKPKVAFTVDITNMTDGATPAPLAYGVAESQCFDVVKSASFDATAGNIVIDYGTNVLYFEVIAANFTGTYKPTLRLSGLQGTQTAAIDWGVAIGTYDQSLVANQAHTAGVITSPQFTVGTNATSTAAGVSIYVRVTIQNHGFEGLADTPITLAVEAVDGTPTANADVDPDCTTITSYGDLALQTLNLRPTVAPGTPMLPQVP